MGLHGVRNVKSQAAGSRRCRCCYATQGIHELKLWRKHALKPELSPAGFPKQLQKWLIGSYEHQSMSVNTAMIHRWGTRALSKKVSFIAAHTFPLSPFSPSFASTVTHLFCSDPMCHHFFTCYSALFFLFLLPGLLWLPTPFSSLGDSWPLPSALAWLALLPGGMGLWGMGSPSLPYQGDFS